MAPTIYAMHALGVTPEMWQDVREAAPDLHIVAPDMIALLESSHGDQSLARLLGDLRDRAPPGPLILMGASIGAHIALELAVKMGERVQGTLLIVPGPAAAPDADFRDRTNALLRTLQHAWTDEMIRNFVQLLVYPFGPRAASIAERVERMFRRSGGRSAPLLALSAAFHGAGELLPRVHGPVRALMAADNANPLTGAVLDEWREVLGSEAVERVTSASEFLPMERPDAVVAALRRMVAERVAGG